MSLVQMSSVQSDVFLVAISVVVYLNALTCGLVFDDVSAVVQNPDLRSSETSLWDIFLHDFWGTAIHLEFSHKSYRPLTVLSFRANYFFHELEPLGYHFVNVLLHSVVTVLFHRVSTQIFFDNAKTGSYAFIGSVLFALHPIHTEAVVGVVGRAEELAAIFFFLALLSYHQKQIAKFLLFTLCSFFSKEQGITVLGVCLIYELTINLVERGEKSTLKKTSKPLSKCPLSCDIPWKSVNRIILVMTVGLSLITFRIWLMGGSQNFPVFTKFDNPASFAGHPTRTLTYNYLLALNTLSLLFPLNLCCDWTMKSIPLLQDCSDYRNIGTLVFYLALVTFCWKAIKEFVVSFRTKSPTKLPLILSLVVLPFVPASNLIVPVGFVLAERTLYLPSAGFCLLIARGIQLIYTNQSIKSAKQLLNPLLLVTIFAFTLKTVTRSAEWKNELTLFESGIKINPTNAKLYNNIGHYYEKQRNWTEAMRYFEKAQEVQPDDMGATMNIARSLINLGLNDEAEAILWEIKPKIKSVARANSKRIAPNYLNLWINLGNIIATNESRLEEAEQVYLELIAMRSDFVEAYINLGDVLIKQDRVAEALKVYESALKYDHKRGDIYYNVGVALSLLVQKADESVGAKDDLNKKIEVEKIVSMFNKALEHNPTNRNALINLAIMTQKYPDILRSNKKQLMERMASYRGDEQERVWFNLALLFSDEGDNKTAEYYLRKAITIKADFRSALFNLALILIDAQRHFEAEIYLVQLLQHHPDHDKSLLLLGDIYIEFNQYDKAEECYLTILKRDERNVEALQNLCMVHLKRENKALAKECFEKVKQLAPQENYVQNLKFASALTDAN